MVLDDVLRSEVLGERRSDKLETSQTTTMENREESWDSERLVRREPESGKSKLKGKILSLSKERKKGGEMLVMGKTPSAVDHNDLLMDIEVSGSQGIRDDLRRLARGYLNKGLRLLEIDYQPNK